MATTDNAKNQAQIFDIHQHPAHQLEREYESRSTSECAHHSFFSRRETERERQILAKEMDIYERLMVAGSVGFSTVLLENAHGAHVRIPINKETEDEIFELLTVAMGARLEQITKRILAAVTNTAHDEHNHKELQHIRTRAFAVCAPDLYVKYASEIEAEKDWGVELPTVPPMATPENVYQAAQPAPADDAPVVHMGRGLIMPTTGKGGPQRA